MLFVRSARFITTTNLPPLESIEQFCRDFDPAQACWAPDRGEHKLIYYINPT